ncbi:alpha-mannosidase [Homoserinimonas sp. A447]
MSKHILPRLQRFLIERLEPAQYRATAPVEVHSWKAPDEPVPFTEAARQQFRQFAVGTPWGHAWGTTWFRVNGTVPAEWLIGAEDRLELVVDLGFTPGIPGFQSEALVFDPDGSVVSALEPLNRSVAVSVQAGEPFEFYLEAASNPDVAQGFTFRETPNGDKATAQPGPLYVLRDVRIAVLDLAVWELLQDFRALGSLAQELPAASPRLAEVLRAIDQALDVLDPVDLHGTADAGRDALSTVLASPAVTSAHRVHAVGHAHIDSAWLWPLRETRRKVARTFSNVLRLQEQHPDFIFAAGSAQQFAWIKQDYPELFARVVAAVAGGRFVPVGGQWVEPDSNLPSGESLARQFVEGKKFFAEEFGVEPREVWLPDSFGYSGALPQIAIAGGADYFLTQKISWNDTNVFPHHTFLWEGIDGSRIFTHFPPADTYNSMVSAEELHRAERQFRDKGASKVSLLPFGWGDGGGGPTREMLASARRFADLEGSPRVELSTPQRFFEEASAEYEKPPVWVGELYLEFHRGVATTQIELKRGNRLSESLLRQAEYWSTHAAVTAGFDYPTAELQRLWREVLLLQFHDILPGTSIRWVHREAEESYRKVHAELEALIDTAARAALGDGEFAVDLNAGPYPVDAVPAFAAAAAVAPVGQVTVTSDAEGTIVENGLSRVRIDTDGNIASFVDDAAGRELVPHRMVAGLLQLHRDTPTQWNAWDLDESYRRSVEDILAVESIVLLSDGVQVSRAFGRSNIAITYRLRPGSPTLDVAVDLDWHEDEKILKLAFPLDLHATRAASEIQYGHLYRDIHTNTSWDAARFETVAHRWLQLDEGGYGVALANEATYGYDVTRDVVDGVPNATVRVSLARAPRYPDPESDRGRHVFGFSLRPGSGIADAVREGYRLHVPLRRVDNVASDSLAPLFSVEGDGAVVEAVKLAEDGSGDVIVRLYEAFGSRTRATLTVDFDHGDVTETDLLERGSPRRAVVDANGPVRLELRPFQLVTLRFRRG